jgi:RES domain
VRPSIADVVDLTDPTVLGLVGLTAEIHSTSDYTLTQGWALALQEAGHDGIRYRARHDPHGELVALQLRVARRDTDFDPSVLPTNASIQEVFGALADDEERTKLIADEALELIDQGRSPIVLTERREHLEKLQLRLVDRAPALVALHGEMSAAVNRAATERLAAMPQGEPCLVLATGRYVGEGFDEPRRMYAKRLKAYRSLGYEVEEPQPASGTEPLQGVGAAVRTLRPDN